MEVRYRLPPLAAVLLLLLAAPFAGAESPLPDPVAPAVIGRPLDQLRPARPLSQRPAAAKPSRRKEVAAASVPARAQRLVAVAPAPAVQEAMAAPRAPQLVPASRIEPRTQVAAANPPNPGAYFTSKDQALVRSYYEAHPASAEAPKWKIGDPIPPRAALTGVPRELRAALSTLPPGHQYVQVDNEVALVAVQSRVVVDAIPR